MARRWGLVRALVLVAVLAPLTASAASGTDGEAAHWRTIASQGFEAAFPTGAWHVTDANGDTIGPSSGAVWDDASTRAHTGTWSASPTDGANSKNLVDTWMTYGPFSLAGASNGRFSFAYWLESEQTQDFLSWSYACHGTSRWTDHQVSGTSDTNDAGTEPNWRTVTVSLRSCVGSTNVYVRFGSNTSNSDGIPYRGPYVDDVRIQRFA